MGCAVVKAMILAAGFGKRMLPLTATTPKPLLCVNNIPLIDYHLYHLSDIGIKNVVINHAHLGTQIEEYCGLGDKYGLHIHYSRESEPLETAGGIAKALPLLGDKPFISINGDIWTDYPLQRLYNLTLDNALAHLVLVKNPAHHTQGDFALNSQGRVMPVGDTTYTYSGIAVFSKQLFDRYKVYEGALSPLLRLAIADGLVSGEYYQGRWFDVGTPQRLQEVSEEVALLQQN